MQEAVESVLSAGRRARPSRSSSSTTGRRGDTRDALQRFGEPDPLRAAGQPRPQPGAQPRTAPGPGRSGRACSTTTTSGCRSRRARCSPALARYPEAGFVHSNFFIWKPTTGERRPDGLHVWFPQPVHVGGDVPRAGGRDRSRGAPGAAEGPDGEAADGRGVARRSLLLEPVRADGAAEHGHHPSERGARRRLVLRRQSGRRLGVLRAPVAPLRRCVRADRDDAEPEPCRHVPRDPRGRREPHSAAARADPTRLADRSGVPDAITAPSSITSRPTACGSWPASASCAGDASTAREALRDDSASCPARRERATGLCAPRRRFRAPRHLRLCARCEARCAPSRPRASDRIDPGPRRHARADPALQVETLRTARRTPAPGGGARRRRGGPRRSPPSRRRRRRRWSCSSASAPSSSAPTACGRWPAAAPQSVCKIHSTGGVVFGFAGAVSSERFDATSIAAARAGRPRRPGAEGHGASPTRCRPGSSSTSRSRRIDADPARAGRRAARPTGDRLHRRARRRQAAGIPGARARRSRRRTASR